MSALSPFSIDMYLPAFNHIALEFSTSVAHVSLSLTSYFFGMAFGRLFWGPLLDCFGRKRPIYVGLALYTLACFGCATAPSTGALVVWRLVQALSGCVAGVAALAVVRDLFRGEESARTMSLMILIMAVSPLVAPTLGGFVTEAWSWRSLFLVLAALNLGLIAAVRLGLPETHAADPKVSLHPLPILQSFFGILRNARFSRYVFSGGLAFSALYLYLAGAPIIFVNHFGRSEREFGWIFAVIAAGMTGASQLNGILLRRLTSERLCHFMTWAQLAVAVVFVVGVATGWFGLYSTVAMFFLVVACLGLGNPNAVALALEPFGDNAGRAAALLGFTQIGLGSAISMLVGLLGATNALPIVILIAVTSAVSVALLVGGTRAIAERGSRASSPGRRRTWASGTRA